MWAMAHQNPRNGWVSPLGHEPRVALAVLEAILVPHVSSGRLVILRQHRPVAVNLAGAEHVTGSEARADTGEPGAAGVANPQNIQTFSVCFVMDAAGDSSDPVHLVNQPGEYERRRDVPPRMTPPWPGPMLSWRGLNPRTMAEMDYRFHPHREKPGLFSGLWSFRRIIDRTWFRPGFCPSDVC